MKKKMSKSGYGSKKPVGGGHKSGYKSASASSACSHKKKRGGC